MQATYLPREVYESQKLAHEVMHKLFEHKLETLQKIVFVGMGIIIAIQFVIQNLK
jgi:hypothetical protein